jgi:hypothetical protein
VKKMAQQLQGRVIRCGLCGEPGIAAGGLRKVGDSEYQCNNSQKCGVIQAEKQAIMDTVKSAKTARKRKSGTRKKGTSVSL